MDDHAEPRPNVMLVQRPLGDLANFSDPGSFAWEILRRRHDYRAGGEDRHVMRTARRDAPLIVLRAPPPDPGWGLCFRRGS